MTDQIGTVHQYAYDKLGRLTADAVTILGSQGGVAVDGSIRRIERGYEVRGMLAALASYNAATSGSVVNEVALTYNDFAQLKIEYQEHEGAVNTGTTRKV